MGLLLGASSRGAVFFADETDGPLARRCLKPARMARSEAEPGPIEVALVPGSDAEPLTHVAPRLLEAVPGLYPNMLEDLAETAGGEPGGLRHDDLATLSRVMQVVLHHIEDDATDPGAVRRAREALERPFVHVTLEAEPGSAGPRVYRCDTLDADGIPISPDLRSMLQGLEVGGHLLLHVAQACDDAVHWLAICATRISDRQVQVNLFNPNGWGALAGRNGFDRIPAIGKSLSIEEAAEALSDLNGGVIDFPAAVRSSRAREQWHNVGGGSPLSAWLRAAGPATLQLAPHRMTPQKSEDCGVEVEFAWLASVLPEQDYKLAKAHGLNVLLQAAEANDLDESVTQRLRERITSSLSGHSMATGG
ncbi:hypothetical protein [Ideonella sp. YS5]|uniref:hypothetical protein n=1 Tax=Ideonella sp. YS5 TaxID=3453714 RepID=UPI003EED8114